MTPEAKRLLERLFGGVFEARRCERLGRDLAEQEVFGGVPDHVEASGTSPYFGLGGRYWVNRNMAICASWERFFDVGEANVTGEGDIDNLWVGLDYRFQSLAARP